MSDQEAKRAEDHWKYLVFAEKKDRSLEAMENKKSNESAAVITDLEDTDKTSNMSKTNSSHNHSTADEGEILFDNNSGAESIAGGSQQTNRIERRRKSIVFTSKRKLSSRGADNEELDDSGLVFDNSIDRSSAMESDSVFVGEKSTMSKTSFSHDQSTSDEGEISLDNSSKNDNAAAKNLQASEVERRRKLSAPKRKLPSQETDDQELDDFGNKPNKRGRGKYKLRDLSQTNSPDNNINKKEPNAKHGSNKAAKRNTIQADTDDETEDSAIEEETGNYEAQNEDESLSRSQIAHNAKILKLINEGSPAKLRTLYRIGLKTAMMIHQYRKLNGKLKSIRELENMTGWSPKFFELFLLANNIKLD